MIGDATKGEPKNAYVLIVCIKSTLNFGSAEHARVYFVK